MTIAADCNHLVHLFWHMAAAKVRKETGNVEAMPDLGDVHDWFLNRLDNLHTYAKDNGHEKFIAVFDCPRSSFRKAIYSQYKAGRHQEPTTVWEAISDAKQALKYADDWIRLEAPNGYEADDVLASIAHQCKGPVVIHSPDKDFHQCLCERVSIIKKSYMEDTEFNDYGIAIGSSLVVNTFTIEDYNREFDFGLNRWLDYQALVGDSADNIKGAQWIGDVKARAILHSIGDQQLEELDGGSLPLSSRQLAAWPDFLQRLPLLRALLRLHTNLDLGELLCHC